MVEKSMKRFLIFIASLFFIIAFAYAIPLVSYTASNPANNLFTTNTSIELNFSITESSLGNITYNWNNTNYTIYDNNLLLYMNFNNNPSIGETGTIAVDNSKKANNGTCSGMGTNCNYTTGKYGNGIAFDGSNDYITVSELVTNNLTVALWLKRGRTGNVGDLDRLVVSTNFHGWGFYFKSSADTFTFGKVGDSGVFSNNGITDTTTWHHVALTYDKVNACFYIDGSLDVCQPFTDEMVASGTYNIGSRGEDEYFKGTLDEIIVMNKSLSSDEIKQLYMNNLNKFNQTQWYLYVNQSQNATTGLSNGQYGYQLFVTNSSGSLNSTRFRTFTVDTVYPQITFINNTPANSFNTTNTTLEINISISELNLANLIYNWNNTNYTIYNESLVLMMNFDNRSLLGENSTYAVDVSRYGNNGTLINGPFWNITGKYGNSIQFDGNNDYIDLGIPSSTKITDNITLSAWVKTSATSNAYRDVIANQWNYQDSGIMLTTYGASTLHVPYSNGSSFTYLDGTYTFSDGNWHFIATTFSSGNLTIYADGRLINSGKSTTLTKIGYNNVNKLLIGKDSGTGGTEYFNGSVDEVRIWNRSLSADEIYQSYISNLQKFNSTQWYLYVNQSKNSTNDLGIGNYTYQVFASDLAGNNNQTEQRVITIQERVLSKINLDWIYPTINTNVTQLEFFNISVNISCLNANCGQINITLDPETNTIYNFTTCGKTGNTGPNQTQCNTDYTGTTLAGLVNVTSGYQKWVVPATGTYRIESNGAGGGRVPCTNYYRGYGARVTGEFSLQAGEILFIVVGQLGWDNPSCDDWGGGGGGFSAVAKNVTSSSYRMNSIYPGTYVTPLIVAGGAGGTGDNGGNNGNYNATSFIPGIGAGGNNGSDSGGGAGFVGNGGAGNCGAIGPQSFLNGSNGSTCSYYGGFGGGGAPYNSGGGGGGFTGGNGTGSVFPGYGGISYNSGTNQINLSAANNKSGYITITYLGSVKGGTVSTNSSATPFWTNVTNPYNLTLNEGESQTITWTVNATGTTLNSPFEFFIYANITTNLTIGNQTSKINITIKDTFTPIINITYPLNSTYNYEVTAINYTYYDYNGAGYCWYSNSSGIWNSTAVLAGINFTNVSTNKNSNEFIIYCNDSSGNLNSTIVIFEKRIPQILLDWIYPNLNINVTQLEFFNISINISCLDGNCGDINVTLDPTIGTNYTFTTCGASGRLGPNQSRCNTNYSGTSLAGLVTVGNGSTDNGTQYWTVPATGTYSIETYGAEGGRFTARRGGYGAYMKGEFDLTAGEVIQILVGQAGGNGASSNSGTGGGGGSFVVRSGSPLIVAGGGGGQGGCSDSTGNSIGLNGTTSMNGLTANGGNGGTGGTNGGGGGANTSSYPGGGGGGFSGNGTYGTRSDSGCGTGAAGYSGLDGTTSRTAGGASFNSGGAGGRACYVTSAIGGFGGGGGEGGCGGAGGGGYSGGGGGYSDNYGGGGGGSYNIGTNQINISGNNTGHGRVVITYLSSSSLKSGTVSTNSSATPFWTNITNPYNLTLNEGESQIITWWVNATGRIPEFSYEFFIYANVSANLTIGNQTSKINITIKDTFTPIINITYPLNSTYSSNVSQINYTFVDYSTGGNCWYSNSSGMWNSSSVSAGNNITNAFSIDGSNSWTVYCNDSAGNINFSSITFYKDTINPNATLISPMNATYTSSSPTNFTANVSDNLGIANVTIRVYNASNYLSNTTNVSYTAGVFNSTVGISIILNDGVYKWSYQVFDWSGNNFTTLNNTVTIDTNYPKINITYPINRIYYSLNVSQINYTLNETNAGSCWWSNSSGMSNSTPVTARNNWTSLTSLQGWNNWTVYCNDSAGNINFSSVTFYKDTINPNATLISPTNATGSSNITYNFTANVSDNVGIANVTIKVYNASNYLVNQTTANYTEGNLVSLVGIIVTLVDGVYKWFFQILDFSGNSFVTQNNTLTIDSLYPLFFNYTDNNASVHGSGVAWFNVTAINTNKTVWLEINGINYSASNSSATVWNYSLSLVNETYRYRWWAYGNGTLKNLNSSEIRYYTVNNTHVAPTVSMELIYPTTDLDINQSDSFNVTINISCSNWHCGQINITLDPVSNLLTNGNFETGNINSWTSYGSASWSAQSTTKYEGTYAGKSGTIGNSVYTAIEQNVSLSAASTLNFWWSVSSENGCDYLGFCIDKAYGVTGCKFTACGDSTGNVTSITGSVSWTKVQVNLSSGTHRLLWYYAKDGSVATGSDAGWIDNVTIMGDTGKGGIVSTNSSATPFWTNISSNPYNINLDENQSQVIVFWVNASGRTPNNPYTFFVYANETMNFSVGNQTVKWNVTIKDFVAPAINITYPLNINYSSNVSQINYTFVDYSTGGNCWYSNSSGMWNSSSVSAGNNITNAFSFDGSNSWTLYCNDSAGNLNFSSVTFLRDIVYPSFSNYKNNNATMNGSGIATFNVTISNTNGTVWIEINGTNYTASNISVNIWNYSILLTNGTYLYRWISWGNGTLNNFNSSSYFNYTLYSNLNIINFSSVNATNFTDGFVPQGTNVTINAYIENAANVFLKVWQTFIGGVILWQGVMINTVGNLWTAIVPTNISWPVGQINYTVFANDSLRYQINLSGSFNVTDTRVPEVNLKTPVNGTIVKNETQYFSANFTDNVLLINTTLYIWNSTNSIINVTSLNITGTGNLTNISVSLPYDDVFKWNYYSCDNSSNCVWNNTNWTITYDTTHPSVVINYPINTTYNINMRWLNYTYLDVNPNGSCWYSNSSGFWNSSLVIAAQNFTNVNSTEGNNILTVYCNDSAGNINYSSVNFVKNTPVIFIDRLYPLTDIISGKNFWFNVTVNVSCLNANCGEINVTLDPAAIVAYNFTTCGVSGTTGPSQANCVSAYTGTSLAGLVNVSGGIQNWTVPTTGTYIIEAYGSQGGTNTGSGGKNGGLGAKIVGQFSLNAGDKLKILVGQQTNSSDTCGSAGGGGGTFVAYLNNTPLIIAGGGGGAGRGSGPSGNPGLNGTSGGTSPNSPGGAGGTNGGGGGIPTAGCSGPEGSGGGGFYGNGTNNGNSLGGKAFISGGSAGTGSYSQGSFGGGGATEYGGGGGGGYSGGGAGGLMGYCSCSYMAGGGGGGSYNSGTDQNNTANYTWGQGFVIITLIGNVKGGAVSTSSSATPFWTNVSNPYTINLSANQSQVVTWWVNATGTYDNYTFFVYANKTEDQTIGNLSTTWNVTVYNLTLDATAPTVNLILPINGSGSVNSTQYFFANFTDNSLMANATLFIWNSTGLINTTNVIINGTFNQTNISVTLPYTNSFKWNYYACDNVSNCGYSISNFTFYYDLTPPYFTVIGDVSVRDNESLTYDINASDDLQLDGFLINWTTNFTINRTTGILKNNTALAIGNYYINVTINDTANNFNYSVILLTVTNSSILDFVYPIFSGYSDNNASITSGGTATFSVNVTNTNGTVWLRINGTTYYATNFL